MGCETKGGPKTWDPWGRHAQKDKKNMGPRGDGLQTARSGRVTKPRRRPMSLDPSGRYVKKKKARKPVGWKTRTWVDIVGPLGQVRRKKRRKMSRKEQTH